MRPPSVRANSARLAARSNGCGALARRQRRRGAPRGFARKFRRRRRRPRAFRRILPLQCSTMSQPAAMAARVRSASEPDNAPMETSSLINRPWKPIESRITSRTIVAEVVAGATGSIALNTTCAVIAERQARQRPECGEIGGFQRRPVGTDHDRQPHMAVGGGPAMAGNVLEHRQNAALAASPSATAPAMAATLSGLGRHRRDRRSSGRPRRPAHPRAAGNRRRCRARARSAAISRAPSCAAAKPARAIAVVERAIGGARRIDRPMRRPEALHAAAFLVDQDRGLAAERARALPRSGRRAVPGPAMLRLKRMNPNGVASRRNARSLCEISSVPARPV